MEKQFDQEIQEEKDADYIVGYMHEMFVANSKDFESPIRYYVGIAKDMDQNYSRHKRDFDGMDFNYTAICKCKDADIAAEVEQRLGDRNFYIGEENIGGKGGTEESVYVYMFRRPDRDLRNESIVRRGFSVPSQ